MWKKNLKYLSIIFFIGILLGAANMYLYKNTLDEAYSWIAYMGGFLFLVLGMVSLALLTKKGNLNFKDVVIWLVAGDIITVIIFQIFT